MNQLELGHLSIEAELPFANAGGVAKAVEDVEKLAQTEVAWIEFGTFTIEERGKSEGADNNARSYNSRTGINTNAVRLANPGMDTLERDLLPDVMEIGRAAGKNIVLNLAPIGTNNGDVRELSAETDELIRRGYESGVNAVLLNLSCRNVVDPDGQQKMILSNNFHALQEVLSAQIAAVEKYEKVFARIAPVDTRHHAAMVADVIARSDVISVVFTPNTWEPSAKDKMKHEFLNENSEAGGVSGPAFFDKSMIQGAWITEALRFSPGNVSTVLSSGIDDGKKLRLGLAISQAVAGAGTTIFDKNKDWKRKLRKMKKEYLDSAPPEPVEKNTSAEVSEIKREVKVGTSE